MGQTSTRFLLDSGAAVSVVRYDSLDECWRQRIKDDVAQNTVAADGLPLEVVGHIGIPVSLGKFGADHEFTVVKNLSVECILGADFLVRHDAVIDCRENTLALGDNPRCEVPISIAPSIQPSTLEGITVAIPDTMEIPARSVMLITAQLSRVFGREGFVEPLSTTRTGIPKGILVARTLTQVGTSQNIVLEVTNISPTPTKVYKGTTLGTFTPMDDICVVNSVQDDETQPGNTARPPEVDLTETDLSPTQCHELLDLLATFTTLFATPENSLGKTSVVKHGMQTTGAPIRQPLRRLPESLKLVVEQEVEKMLNQGVVRPSTSPWSSPIVMVRKKDGSWRFCVDYRKVNAVTRQDAYPLPCIDATLDSLAGSAYFTTLDLASGYWQVELDNEAKEKSAFSTPSGHFEFNVMPFGLTNAPATFQRLMECVLAGLTPSECRVYLDDIIVFSTSFAEHLSRLQAVFRRLQHAGLKLKPNKCYFARKDVRYLGHIVTAEGVKPNPAKTEAVSTYPVPQDVHELRQFLGLANYYRCFVKDYSRIAEPLHQLTRKTSKGFQWTPSCQEAFEELKDRLTTPPILGYPDFSQEFILHTDASATALGAVLCQAQNGQERVISYWSRQLSKPERNYSTIEWEALAAVAAIKEFYPYLYGFSFTLVTDHNPLTALKSLKDVGGRLSRWMMFLQQFQLKIEYKPGKDHSDADALSRRPSGSGGEGGGGDGEGNVGSSGGEGSGGDGDGNVGSSGGERGGGDGDGNVGSSGGERGGGDGDGNVGSHPVRVTITQLQPVSVNGDRCCPTNELYAVVHWTCLIKNCVWTPPQ